MISSTRYGRAWRVTLGFLMTAIPISVWWTTTAARPMNAQTVAWPGFAFYQEFFGPNAYADPQVVQNFNLGMMNGLTFSPPVPAGIAQTTSPYNAGLMLRLPGAPQPSGIAADAIEQQRIALEALAEASPGSNYLWDLLPEWDQGGGAWVAQGRPRYRNMSRANAHNAFLQYYESAYPTLITGYLRTPQVLRKYLLTSVTDNTPNVFDAYELGVEMQLLERGIDELGDLSTGIAYLRGAANQYGRAWGIDLSTYRTSTGMATTYDQNGVLQGGWSASYLRRIYYQSYLSGAQLIQNEATSYRYANGNLNPFGAVTQEFADFSLRRHPDLGQPYVATALMVNPDSGFDPKHGIYNQNNAVWYQDLPYAGGDTMTNQFLNLAYPNHWMHGLAPGAPFANSAGVPNTKQFLNYLAAGNDPRPYEPMPNSRWGSALDVITTRAGANALNRYRVIILMGDVTLGPAQRSMLTDWVSAGGLLLMNAVQSTADDQSLLGVTFDNTPSKISAFSRWTPDDPGRSEPLYSYISIHPDTAQVWAVNDSGDPLVTANTVGGGQVIFTTFAYLEPVSRDGLLNISVQLLDWVFQQYSPPVVVAGPQISYVVNALPNKLVVGMFNSSSSDWNGQLSATLPVDPDRVSEYVGDQAVNFSSNGGVVTVPAQVPAFEVKVFAIEYSNVGSSTPPQASRLKRSRPHVSSRNFSKY